MNFFYNYFEDILLVYINMAIFLLLKIILSKRKLTVTFTIIFNSLMQVRNPNSPKEESKLIYLPIFFSKSKLLILHSSNSICKKLKFLWSNRWNGNFHTKKKVGYFQAQIDKHAKFNWKHCTFFLNVFWRKPERKLGKQR